MPASITPINIHVGKGDIWIGVDVPPEGQVVPINENGEPSTGRNIGATTEGTNWIYRPTTLDIRIEQSTTLAGAVTTEEEMRLEFTVGELTYINIKDMFQTPRDQGQFISLGGLIVPAVNSVLIVSRRRGGGFIEAMLYSGFFTEDRSVAVSRASITGIKTVARGLGLLSRTPGDQLGFFAPSVVGTNPPGQVI